MRRVVILALCASSSAWGMIETKPWLPSPFEPQAHVSYTYSTFRHVNDAHPQLPSRSHDHLIEGGVGLATMNDWAGDLDLEFAHTPRFTWGMRSVAAQLRKMWFNDIVGDAVTLTTGFLLRVVPPKPLEDVSTPYHHQFNGELNIAMGKEWSQGFYWKGRCYLFGGVGLANRGAPWIRSKFSLAFNCEDRWHVETFALFYRGYGHRKEVDPEPCEFHGWKTIAHRSLDLALSLKYQMKMHGAFRFEVMKRVYARSFPENNLFFTIRYDFPLSI